MPAEWPCPWLSCGLVMRMPGCMQELLRLLSRRQHHSMPLAMLEEQKLTSSPFPAQFHIKDCAGRGLVNVVHAPAGKLVQLVRRRK